MKGIYLPEWQIKAAIDGRMKQFTKPLKEQPNLIRWNPIIVAGYGGWTDEHGYQINVPYHICIQYYVKETWRIVDWSDEDHDWMVEYKDGKTTIIDWIDVDEYKAEDYCIQCTDECIKAEIESDDEGYFWFDSSHPCPTRWRSPVTMPAWAARIFITPTSIKVRRVQELDEGDFIFEGCPNEYLLGKNWFVPTWDKQYPKTPWDSNPWVVTYKCSIEVKR